MTSEFLDLLRKYYLVYGDKEISVIQLEKDYQEVCPTKELVTIDICHMTRKYSVYAGVETDFNENFMNCQHLGIIYGFDAEDVVCSIDIRMLEEYGQ